VSPRLALRLRFAVADHGASSCAGQTNIGTIKQQADKRTTWFLRVRD
jgi:hypothetical protein